MMKFCCRLFLLFVVFGNAHATTQWTTIAPGIDYTELSPPSLNLWGTLHAFRIDLNKNQLLLASSEDVDRKAAMVKTLAQHHGAMLGVNGGFFTPFFSPIGLRIQNGVMSEKIKPISWWGIFYVRGNQAFVTSPKTFPARQKIDFAIQAGPRLVINGRIPKLKEGVAQRTAIGITRDKKIIILASDNAPLHTNDLAQIMSRPYEQDGLNCSDALNLDGGSSTQLFAQIGKLQLDIAGISSIADAVLVKARSSNHSKTRILESEQGVA